MRNRYIGKAQAVNQAGVRAHKAKEACFSYPGKIVDLLMLATSYAALRKIGLYHYAGLLFNFRAYIALADPKAKGKKWAAPFKLAAHFLLKVY